MAEYSDTQNASSNSFRSAPKESDVKVTRALNSLKEAYSTAQQKALGAKTSSEEFVKAKPIRTVLGAAAIGFAVGMIARRKH